MIIISERKAQPAARTDLVTPAKAGAHGTNRSRPLSL